jgi:hypothetical protein
VKVPRVGGTARPWADALRLAALRKTANGQTMLNRMAERAVKMAVAGDTAAMQEIGIRLDGRVNLQADDVKPALDLQSELIHTLVGALVERKRAPSDDAKTVEAKVEQLVERKREGEPV